MEDTVERATIDTSYGSGLKNANLGDVVGWCKGKVVGFVKGGITVDVYPSPNDCDGCELSEHCDKSKAD